MYFSGNLRACLTWYGLALPPLAWGFKISTAPLIVKMVAAANPLPETQAEQEPAHPFEWDIGVGGHAQDLLEKLFMLTHSVAGQRLSAEIVDQHDVARGYVILDIQEPAGVGRYGDMTAARSRKGLLRESRNPRQPAGGEAEKFEHGANF